uniref:G-protein coupled receptors family 1 profile domain-containing protein n=1 Tax=Oreochromis aureus TaxID=47969 RepID=A0A668V802_OREAU
YTPFARSQKTSANSNILVARLEKSLAPGRRASDFASPVCVFLYAFLSIFSVITICGNLLVIISVIYFKQLHTPTNSLILSLAVADLLVGIIVFPLSMAFSLSSCLYHEGLFCKVRGTFDISLSTCSILNLCCISIDRYHAVCQPLTYQTKISHHVVVVTIAGLNNENCQKSSLIGIVVGNTIGIILSFYLPVITMLCIYLKIFFVARRQARSIQNTTKCGQTASMMERKVTKTLAIVLGVVILCWSPFFLCITFPPLTRDSVPVSVIKTLNWLTLANSMLNPFIYAFFYRDFASTKLFGYNV